MRLTLFAVLLVLVSCKAKEKTPEGILPLPKMTNLLWDAMLADELVAQTYPADTGTIRFDTSIVLYSQIAKAHNTTQKEFKQSLQYYKTRPDLMQVIIDSLTARSVLPTVTPKDSLRRDSLPPL